MTRWLWVLLKGEAVCRRVKEKLWAGGLGALSGEDEIWGQRWKRILFSNY